MLDALRQLLPIGETSLEAELEGVDGYTGAGQFRYSVSRGGSTNYQAELKGVAGLRAELFAQGEFVAPIPCDKGRASAAFDSRLGDLAIRLHPGDLIEIRQNGFAILKGVLRAAG